MQNVNNDTERQKAMETIQNLESQVRELSKKCDLESVLCEELNLEIQSLQKSLSKAVWNTHSNPPATDLPDATTAMVTQERNNNIKESKGDEVCDQTDVSTESCSSVPVAPPASLEATATESHSLDLTVVTPIGTSATYLQNSSLKYLMDRPTLVSATVVENSNASNGTQTKQTTEATTNEIKKIMARIEQDNKLLAELEKSRGIEINIERPKPAFEEKKIPGANHSGTIKSSITIPELEKLMAKLEQDNRILAELDKKRSALDFQGLYSTNPSSIDAFQLAPTPSPSLVSLRDHSAHAHVPASGSVPALLHHHSINGSNTDEMLDLIDFIELPGRGRCNIYCARYTYDPIKQSPNENPEAELCLSAGDYVIIYGEMDEDGFFLGELLDGRKGLVPSNFVEKLTGEELFDFHATVLYGNRDSDDSSVSFSYAQDLETQDFVLPEDFHRMNDYIDLDDIEDVDEDKYSNLDATEEELSRGVPPPQRLIVERQLNKSILIGWVPPSVFSEMIEAYHVYVDGVPRVTVKSTERTRALIENVDSSKPHRISVRSVSNAGYHSKDAACTIVVGKDFPLAPTCMKASQITATSALISWLPSNSNFQHIVAVNSVEVKVVQPGYFRHTVTGLSPNNVYRVSIRVRPGKLLYNDEKNPKKLEMLVSNVEFRTLPKGLPDAPVNVQVEQGPQDGTLLVTWLPVPSQPISPLVSPVTGYAVFASGKQVAEVNSPSGDHALIDGCQLLLSEKKCVTVRSKSVDGFSADSIICLVPNEILRTVQKTQQPLRSSGQPGPALPSSGASNQRWKDQTYNGKSHDGPLQKYQQSEQYRNSPKQMVIDPEESLSDKEIYPSSNINIPSIEITKENIISAEINDIDGYSEEDFNPGSRSKPMNTSDDVTSSHQRQARHRSDPSLRHSRPKQHGDTPTNPQRRTSLHNAEQQRVSIQQQQQQQQHRKSPHHRGGQHCQPSSRGTSSQNKCSPNPLPSQRPLDTNQPRPRMPSHIGQFSQKGDQNSLGPNSNPGHYQKRRTSVQKQRTNDYHQDMLSSKYEAPLFCDSLLDKTALANGGDNRVRYFVALFDYDPQTMSPNPDAADEELPFQEGQLIKIHGDKDSDGFYRGESNGQIGLVPGNMVSEVQVEEESIPRETTKMAGRPSSLKTLPPSERVSEENWSPKHVRKMVAIYDYDPQVVSPNVDSEMELSFTVGDTIYVIGDVDEDGFYVGELNGIKGLVPSNFLREGIDEEHILSKVGIQENYGYPRSPLDCVGFSQELGCAPEKTRYLHKNNPKELARYSSWNTEDADRGSIPRGPQIPPRALRHQSPSDHTW